MNVLKRHRSYPCGNDLYRCLAHGTDFVLNGSEFSRHRNKDFTLPGCRDRNCYRQYYTVVGGYVTAALAPDPPMRYVIILGLIGLTLGTLAAIGHHTDEIRTAGTDRAGRTSAALRCG